MIVILYLSYYLFNHMCLHIDVHWEIHFLSYPWHIVLLIAIWESWYRRSCHGVQQQRHTFFIWVDSQFGLGLSLLVSCYGSWEPIILFLWRCMIDLLVIFVDHWILSLMNFSEYLSVWVSILVYFFHLFYWWYLNGSLAVWVTVVRFIHCHIQVGFSLIANFVILFVAITCISHFWKVKIR